jgi:hypothetical protein
MKPNVFEETSIALVDDNVFANRTQLQELYQVPRKTLADQIKRLKQDGLVNGAKSRHVAKDGKMRVQEVFDLDEIISIGMRLRSDRAITFQRWARSLIKNELLRAKKQIKSQQIQLDYFWDKEDQLDLYR